MLVSRITAMTPLKALEGGRVIIHGDNLLGEAQGPPSVRIGDAEARVARASSHEIHAIVPGGVGGRLPVRVAGVPGATPFLEVGALVVEGVHLVDNPVFDARGTLYVTFSGTRSQQSAVTIYRIRPGRAREPFVTSIAHPTSMAIGPDGALYVTDRFEGSLYRVQTDGGAETIASGLGVPCGVAFGADSTIYVGDRSGAIVRIDRGGARSVLASLPPSVAAFHLAWGADGRLYVAAPTLDTGDPVYRVSADGSVETLPVRFGRPQGLAFDGQGRLHVCEAQAGGSGLYRFDPDHPDPELVVAAQKAIGLAFDPAGALVVTSGAAVYRF